MESIAEQTVTLRKLLKTRIAERAGKITSAEISKDPTRFIANTIITDNNRDDYSDNKIIYLYLTGPPQSARRIAVRQYVLTENLSAAFAAWLDT